MGERRVGSPQVDAEFYGFSSYVHRHRWVSFWYQIDAILRHAPKTVLEVGPGQGLTTSALQKSGVSVTTFDFDAVLLPDIVGDVRQLSTVVEPRSFDLVCAFQVLEHLPFEYFESIIAGMAATARSNVIISLPHWGYPVELRFRFLKNVLSFSFARKLVRPKDWTFDGQHYWELGTNGHSVSKVSSLIERYLKIERAYFCPDYSYHYFFECSVK